MRSGCGWHHSFVSILFILDEQTGHMGLSLTKCTQEINGKFLQIGKLPSARLTQRLPDAERRCSKLRKSRNVLSPPIPVNTCWKKIQWRGLQDSTVLCFIPMDQSLANQHLRVSSASQIQAYTLSSCLEVSLVIWTIWSVPWLCTNLLQFQRWKAELWAYVWENLSL